ncbi:MAG: hypothetical protein IJ946_00735 [Clostridia bacterium]|nr:hypothetical protein [Clostridia bacterium]
MVNELKNILSMVETSAEEKEKFYAAFENAEAISKAEELLEILYGSKTAEKSKVIYKVEDEQSSIIFSLAYLMRALYIKDYLKEKGIPLEHLESIMGVWRNASNRSFKKYGFYGLNGVYRSFLCGYMQPARYTLGRLNFEMAPLEDNYAVYKTENGIAYTNSDEEIKGECVLKKGDPVLYVHIPENGPLLPDLVDDSFNKAKEFFAAYFPEYNFRAFVCSSWLLDENLKTVLKPTSNIIAFQNRFTIAAKKENNFSLYWHVLGIEDFLPIDQLVPANDFQSRIINHVKEGTPLYSGKGFILV